MSKKHSHYFKPVHHLTEIDVYRVCDLFKINDPSGATQHAIKKLLLPGGRGAGKDLQKDLEEAIDSIRRRLEMLREDEPPTVCGIPFQVEDTMRSCSTLDQVQDYASKQPPPELIFITHELYRKLKNEMADTILQTQTN